MSLCNDCGGAWGHYDSCPQKARNDSYNEGYKIGKKFMEEKVYKLESQVELLKKCLKKMRS